MNTNIKNNKILDVTLKYNIIIIIKTIIEIFSLTIIMINNILFNINLKIIKVDFF